MTSHFWSELGKLFLDPLLLQSSSIFVFLPDDLSPFTSCIIVISPFYQHTPAYNMQIPMIIPSGWIITTSLRPHWKSWLVRGIIPKWPYFRLVNYYNLPRSHDYPQFFGRLSRNRLLVRQSTPPSTSAPVALNRAKEFLSASARAVGFGGVSDGRTIQKSG